MPISDGQLHRGVCVRPGKHWHNATGLRVAVERASAGRGGGSGHCCGPGVMSARCRRRSDRAPAAALGCRRHACGVGKHRRHIDADGAVARRRVAAGRRLNVLVQRGPDLARHHGPGVPQAECGRARHDRRAPPRSPGRRRGGQSMVGSRRAAAGLGDLTYDDQSFRMRETAVSPCDATSTHPRSNDALLRGQILAPTT